MNRCGGPAVANQNKSELAPLLNCITNPRAVLQPPPPKTTDFFQLHRMNQATLLAVLLGMLAAAVSAGEAQAAGTRGGDLWGVGKDFPTDLGLVGGGVAAVAEFLEGGGGQGRRRLPTSCTTAAVATCFGMTSNGDEIELSAGTLSSTDGINSWARLTLQNKHASIACSADGGACVLQGATGKTVVNIYNNGGTSTLSHLVIKDGDSSGHGGGLYVSNSNVVLTLIDFNDNAASSNGGAIYVSNTGTSSVNLLGCSFAGNTAGSAPDVYNYQETVAIGGCPVGKPIRPSTLLQNTKPPPPLPSSSPPLLSSSSLRRLYSNPRFCPEQLQQKRRDHDLPRVQLHVYLVTNDVYDEWHCSVVQHRCKRKCGRNVGGDVELDGWH